ncbi:MAG TPA: YdiU family protein [Sphingomonas sp.]
MSIRFDNSFARLPEHFYARVLPTSARMPSLIRLNDGLARELGFDPDWLGGPEGLAFLTGQRVQPGSDPIATAYAGHQFGSFVSQLGDGRAILLGEVRDIAGRRRDIQLKGSGRTPFSRGGDGKAALGPVLREYVVSEAMAALGIPTTRALAAALTGDQVVRETLLPGAVLTRVALSHIRVGTFQYHAARGDVEALRLLADHVIARHYPEAAEAGRPYRALLDAIVAAQADLVARWLLVGFIHGVMNTDNMSIAGETIDYGPCAFLDAYDPAAVFSSIDQQGRYAYRNQPRLAQWNLTRLAEALLPLLDDDQDKAVADAQDALAAFADRFTARYEDGLRAKLGLSIALPEDVALAEAILTAMAVNAVDFTLFFRRLGDAAADAEQDSAVRPLFADATAYDEWAARWRHRLASEPMDGAARRATMHAVNPAYIPRNHQIEAMIAAAVGLGDFAPFARLLEILSTPFEERPDAAAYAQPPQPHERVTATFCGT